MSGPGVRAVFGTPKETGLDADDGCSLADAQRLLNLARISGKSPRGVASMLVAATALLLSNNGAGAILGGDNSIDDLPEIMRAVMAEFENSEERWF